MTSARRRPPLLAVLAMMCFAGPLGAATVGDLHTATVPVADNSEAEFKRGLEAALQILITKLTGNSRSAGLATVAKLRAQAPQYNTLFGYERDSDGALLLRADFDVPALSGALRARGLPVWGRERPELAAWIVVGGADGRRAAPDAASQEIFDALARQAAVRAIPVRRLRPDAMTAPWLADSIADDEMLGALNTLANQAGAPARLALLIAAAPDGATWQARWQLEVEDEILTGTQAGELPVPVATLALDDALDALARHFLKSVDSGAATAIELVVEEVASADAYGRVLDYLARLDGVRTVAVTRVEGTTLTLQVLAHGGLPAIAQIIGFGRVLSAVPELPGRYRLASP